MAEEFHITAEEQPLETFCTYDLNRIPVKSVKNINNDIDKLSHGCIVGCPKHTNHNKNPIDIFSKLSVISDINVAFGTFIFIRNWTELQSFYTNINEDTLFYYITLFHRKDYISFHAQMEDMFNICINVKKISMNHVHEWREYEFKTDTETEFDPDSAGTSETEFEPDYIPKHPKQHSISTYPIKQTHKYDNTSHSPDYSKLQMIIDSPHGRLSVDNLLKILFRERNVCYVAGIPKSIAKPQILKTYEWFGQFGTVKYVFVHFKRGRGGSRCTIVYDNEMSALNAINYCNKYVFDDGTSLKATFNRNHYCSKFLLPHIECAHHRCSYKHSWANCKSIIPEPTLKNSKNSDFAKETLRKEMVILGENIPVFQLNKFSTIFFKYFEFFIKGEIFGSTKDLLLYFNDIFDGQMHSDNVMHFVSKIFLPQSNNKLKLLLEENEEKYHNLKVEFESLENKMKLYERKEQQNECKIKFKHWLCNVVRLGKYLSVFEENEYDNIQCIEFLSENVIKNDLGITKILHCKLMLKHVEQFKNMTDTFNQILKRNEELNEFQQELAQHGIVTLKHLKNDIKTKQDVENILHIHNNNKMDCVLNAIRSLY